VLQLFGGQSALGLTLDADRRVRPRVVGNAFYPPFRCESFDTVLLDPPYRASNGIWRESLVPAACLARQWVWWFSQDAVDPHLHGLRLHRWWAVVPSAYGGLRYLCQFRRTRHPTYRGQRHCFPVAFSNAQTRKWSWKSRIDQPVLL
jgi:hypothetical protein